MKQVIFFNLHIYTGNLSLKLNLVITYAEIQRSSQKTKTSFKAISQ